MTDTITPDDFWSRLDDIQAGMLAVDMGRPVPMSHYADREANALWFITAKGTPMETALRAGDMAARYVIASGNGKLYATVDGTARLSEDREKLDELWNAVADAWFEDGKDDEDVQLVRFDLGEAEIWATTGGLGFLYEVAKAQITDEKPDIGRHGRLDFAA